MKVQEYNLDLFADYYQFYIQDEQVSGDLSQSWTQDANERFLALAEGTIGIGTARNMTVPVTIKIFNTEPELSDISKFDRVNECDLKAISGRIVVAGCTDYLPEAFRFEVKPGNYRVRVLYSNLDKLSEDRFEGEDAYELHLWPIDSFKGLKVIKKYCNKASA